MSNPKNLDWTGPSTYTDGKPYGQADHGGYDIESNGTLLVSVPFAWNASNVYSFPVTSISNLVQGTNTVRLRTVASNGQVSDWTGSVTFPYLSVPSAPTAVVVQ